MDPEIMAMALARPAEDDTEGGASKRRRGASDAVLQKARAASSASRQAKMLENTRPDEAGAKLAALCIPGVSDLLNPDSDTRRKPKKGHLDIDAMSRLAVSPRIRGSGPAVEKVRRLQNLSCALLGKAAMHLQTAGLRGWLQSPPKPDTLHRVIGFSAMWDEASQKIKGLLSKASNFDPSSTTLRKMTSPKAVQVLVTLGTVHMLEARTGQGEQLVRTAIWMPWLAPPLFLPSTSSADVIEGLRRTLPADLTDPESIGTWHQSPQDKVVVTLCFDFAASNVAAMKRLVASLEESASPVCLHGERCATHCIHLVKAHCIATAELAGVLYSISKLMGNSRTTDNLCKGIVAHVRSSIQYRLGQPPPVTELHEVALSLLGIDGDNALLESAGAKNTRWSDAIMQMMSRSRFDKDTGSWLYYLPQGSALGDGARLHQEAVDYIAQPLVEVFVARRWEIAALSRWTGVMSCLKRMALGVVMNSVLPSALQGLSGRLGVTEAGLQKEMQIIEAKTASGEEADDFAAKTMKRVLRISTFFSEPARRWQVGVTLMCAAVVDKLHWRILGARGKLPKASLGDIVDPVSSVVGIALEKVLTLAECWSADGEWRVLTWFGLTDFADEAPRRWARNTLLRIAAGLFVRTEQRFSSWPYKLAWLISDFASDDEKNVVAKEFLDAPGCCLGPFGRGFRQHFKTVDEVRSPSAESVLAEWQLQLRFTTAPVECDHKQVKEEVSSATSGSSHAPIAYRAVCRHLHQAHKHRGGQDVALPLRRRLGAEAEALAGRCWPDDLKLQPLAGARPQHPPREEQQEEGALVPVAGAGDLAEAHIVERFKLGGGNPKVMYLNFVVQKASAARALSRADVQDLRKEHVQRYDSSEELRARWRKIFDAARRRKAHASTSSTVGPPTSSRSSGLWPGHMQSDDAKEISPLPIAQDRLSVCQDVLFGSVQALEETAKDAKPFSVVTAQAKKKSAYASAKAFACASERRNVCRIGLSDKGLVRRFDRLQAAWTKWFRSLTRAEATSCDIVLQVRSVPADRHSVWLLMSDTVFSPMVQTYVVCCPVGQAVGADGFCGPRPLVPFQLEILAASSRLCHQGVGGLRGFKHMTSDELMLALAARGETQWEVSQVHYTIVAEGASLRYMQVVGFSEPVLLELAQKTKVASADSFYSWLRLTDPRTRGSAAGSSMSPEPQALTDRSWGEIRDIAMAEEAVEEPELSEPEGDELDIVGETGANLEELLSAIFEESEGEGELGDEGALGASEPAGDGDIGGQVAPAVPEGGPRAPDPDDDVVAVVEAISAGLSPEAPGQAAPGASDVAMPDVAAPAEEQFPECGFLISSLGYVRCNRPGFNPDRPIGLVGYKTDQKSIFANCHQHSVCSISAGIMRQDVPPEHMAAWLCKGTPPPPGASVAERKALGVEHRKLWAKPTRASGPA